MIHACLFVCVDCRTHVQMAMNPFTRFGGAGNQVDVNGAGVAAGAKAPTDAIVYETITEYATPLTLAL